ncbi:MAG TPA: hypothetical protein VFX15_03140 [Actinomycetes bacterium]|nr:hypothetical protein [Actinomycetes bacterium]
MTVERYLYIVEWTHDDGMDQHQEFANLTGSEAMYIKSLLDVRKAVDPQVWEVSPTATFEQLDEQIRYDLSLEGEGDPV